MMDTDTERLEGIFSEALVRTLKKVYDECGYYESRFVHMVRELGALRAVKRVLERQQFLFGVAELARYQCLELSVERLVLDQRFSGLFSEEERKAALMRLRNCCTGNIVDMVLQTPRPDTHTC